MKFNYILFLSLLMLLLASACRKESGFIPDYNRGEPYYNAVSFEHLWSESVEPGERENFLRGVKHSSDMVLLVTSNWLGAFSMETGAMLWKYEPEYDQKILEDSDFIESEDKLIFFQSGFGIMTFLNKNTGQLIERKRFYDMPGIQGSPSSVGKWNDKIIVYTRHLLSPGGDKGIHNVYEVDPFEMSVKLLASEEGIHSSSHVKRILIDSVDSKAYVYFRADEDGIRQMNFLEIDLVNHNYRKQRIQVTLSLHAYVPEYIPMLKLHNHLLIELGYEFGTTAINIDDGSVLWNKKGGVSGGESVNYFPHFHLDRLYLFSRLQFLNVDIMTGKEIWSNNGYFISRGGIDFHPQKHSSIQFQNNSGAISIQDLHDGSMLAKLDASSLGTAKYFATNPLFIKQQDAWVVCTDDFTLHCFKWPFN